MSYSANQYNYATPLSSSAGLFGEAQSVEDKKYFTLAGNSLDGSYPVVTGDAGLWSDAAPNSDGTLPNPFVVTINESLTVNAFRLVGSQYSYPVAFTVKFYNGSTLLHTITETANNKVEYVAYLPKTLNVTSYVITITKVSSATSAVRLLNTYNPAYVKRVDTLFSTFIEDGTAESDFKTYQLSDAIKVKTLEKSSTVATLTADDSLSIKESNVSGILNTIHNVKDTLAIKPVEKRSHIRNTIDVTYDTLNIRHIELADPTNIHTVMKEPFRRIYGKVYVTYTDPMLDDTTTVASSSAAYNSNRDQILDTVTEATYDNYFKLYDSDLSGDYVLTDQYSQVGWISEELSDNNGEFVDPPSITVNFFARPIVALNIAFDTYNIVKDFTVTLKKQDGSEVNLKFVDNSEAHLTAVEESIADVVSVTITVHKVSKPNSPAIILDMPISSTVLYRGYKDVSDLMSIDLLEELTYEDEVEALGGVSANEITVVLDNSSKQFFFNSGSIVAKQLKRNRKIVPYLGAEIIPGQIEWYTLGTFWAYRWEVPNGGLTANVVGFDTIGLLSLTPYINHQTQFSKSIGWLLEYVLDDAKSTLDFIEYDIDPSLYEIVIPYAWFAHGTHADALRKISLCYPMHIYCNREGVICAKPQKLHLDYYYDTWSDNDTVISKSYSSLYTALPNVINVTVYAPFIANDEQLVKSDVPFEVEGSYETTLNFNSPYVSDIVVEVDCDDTLDYTYVIYSWGIVITFNGTGTVRTIVCTGSCVDTSNSTLYTRRDEANIKLNGAVTRDVESEFIQTTALAKSIADRLVLLATQDKYDATVKYRGDISLTINDPILLNDGLAPDNRYNIKRHQLTWNGALTGSAELNT